MQRASRFLYSTASQSSPSNITLRTRKRSRTSSAADDCSTMNKDLGNVADASRTKARSAKSSARLLPSNLKSVRKSKSGRASKSNFRSLQNAVVLAPFHTLKKCFQTKLVDLYSFEKMKKINHRTKMAKKKNMCFEYDIIELKPSGKAVKKEGKAVKKVHQKSRSASYCQCKKIRSETDEKMSRKNCNKGRKLSRKKCTTSQIPLSGHMEPRKVQPNNEIVSPMILKSEFASGFDLTPPNGQFFFPDPNLRASAKSSLSRCDSWETYSNSPSCKEEYLEGSLAISATSFDSYLEHFDKNSWNLSDSCRRCRKRAKSPRAVDRIDADFPPKPNANSSRHLIMHVERKNSDGQIVDFMDRDPQTQVISSAESNHHLQPLRRLSKTKTKKLDNEQATSYCLRSFSSSKETLHKGNQIFISPERREVRCSTGNDSQIKSGALRIEVATQVEENNLERGLTTLLKSNQKSNSNAYSMDVSSDKIPEQPLCVTNCLSSDQKIESSSKGSDSNLKAPCKDPRSPRFDAVESQMEVIESQRAEMRMNILGERSDRESIELMTALGDRFQNSSDSPQSQDKESDFIFGPRNTATRLGESCEFPFGLNLAFSDDED